MIAKHEAGARSKKRAAGGPLHTPRERSAKPLRVFGEKRRPGDGGVAVT